MMKKKKFVLFIFVLALMFTLTSCNLEAYGVTKSETAAWFEENLGWFIGIPTGTVLAIIGEVIYLIKSNKARVKDFAKQTLQRAEVAKTIKDVKETNTKLGKFVTKAENCLIETDKKIDSVIDKVETSTNEFKNVAENQIELMTKIDSVAKALLLMANQNEELVANGTAEKINSLLENKN